MTNPAPSSPESLETALACLSGKSLMDMIGSPITIADRDMIIRYANRAAYDLFSDAEQEIQRDLPGFSADTMIGTCVDDYHSNPAHQRRMTGRMRENTAGKLSVGGRHFDFVATPLFDDRKEFVGAIVQWVDQTIARNALAEGMRLGQAFADMAAAHEAGDIDVMASAEGFGAENASVIRQVNDMVQGHIDTKKKAIGFAIELAKGNLDAELETFPRKKAFINEALENVRANFKANAAEVALLMHELKAMSHAHDAGDIDVFVDQTKFSGGFAEVVENVNEMVQGHIDTKKKAIAFVIELANGNFDAHLEQFPRKKAFINEAMENVRNNFRNVVQEMETLSRSIVDGDLSQSVELGQFKGSFRDVIALMLEIIATFGNVTSEIERLSNGIVQGQLDTKVDLNAYKGAYGAIMRAFEASFGSLNSAFTTINTQVGQISTTVDQMTRSSQALATNSQIQSSSVDEVSSSTEETESQVKANATSAVAARDLVVGASVVASEGKIKIGEMVDAMDGIRTSSHDIAKIIKVIDEIAFQTNLLALNAAVEAARAGQHGRGFAVVAQEVRNLAGRSAKAARETSELIESATVRVSEGVRIADETSSAFTSIVHDIEKVRTLVGDIATASEEQSRGVAQINVAVGEIAKSALATSQQADELAASAAQMQAATESMRNEISRFSLRKMPTSIAAGMGLDSITPELLAQIQALLAAQSNANLAPSMTRGVHKSRNSDRDERGFGHF